MELPVIVILGRALPNVGTMLAVWTQRWPVMVLGVLEISVVVSHARVLQTVQASSDRTADCRRNTLGIDGPGEPHIILIVQV